MHVSDRDRRRALEVLMGIDTYDDVPMLSPEQAAAKLGVSQVTIYRVLRSGALPARKVGNRWRIAPRDLKAYGSPGARAARRRPSSSDVAAPRDPLRW